MISYEKALEKANNFIDGDVYKINCAYELPDAYVFDHDTLVYNSHIPFAVLKKNGNVMNFNAFMLAYNHTWDELKPIYFDTGLRIPEEELPKYDDEEDEE